MVILNLALAQSESEKDQQSRMIRFTIIPSRKDFAVYIRICIHVKILFKKASAGEKNKGLNHLIIIIIFFLSILLALFEIKAPSYDF